MLDAKHSNFDKHGVNFANKIKRLVQKLTPIYICILRTLYLLHANCKIRVKACPFNALKLHLFTLKKECKQVSIKNSPNKKGYIGFVGSQPMLLLFDACLNIGVKAIT